MWSVPYLMNAFAALSVRIIKKPERKHATLLRMACFDERNKTRKRNIKII